MYNITGCLIFYNEVESLQQSIPAMLPHVDRIVAIDGAYQNFPHKKPFSTDGSLEYLEQFQQVDIINAFEPWKDEPTKRSRYFDNQSKYYFMFDADEVLEGKGKFLLKTPFYEIRILPRSGGTGGWNIRLFGLQGLRYEGTHYRIVDKNGKLVCYNTRMAGNYNIRRINDFWFKHLHNSSQYHSKDIKSQYYLDLIEKETQFLKERNEVP